MESDAPVGVLIAVLSVVVVAWYLYAFARRSGRLLEEWARENECELLSTSFRLFRKGPYWWSTKAQAVYRVEIRDRQGNLRSGWVRCGGWWLGVFGDQVEAKLDT